MEFAILTLPGGRELVNEARAKELIADWANVTNPKIIRLSNKSFDCPAAQVIADALQKVEGDSLELIDISDIIAGRNEEEALKALRVISSGLERFRITMLNVSDNAFGAKGIEACRGLLEGKPLEKLYVCNNGLSSEAVSLLGEVLSANDPALLHLLHFYNNMSGTEGAKHFSRIIKSHENLEDLRFSATRAGPDGCIEVANAIGALNGLRRLDVCDNTFGIQGSVALAESLSTKTNLEYLNLRDSGLTKKGFSSFLKRLETVSFSKLKVVDISGNELTEQSIKEFTKWLKTSAPQIEDIFLDDNEFGSDGAKVLSSVLASFGNLRLISCCSCEIGGRAGVKLVKAISKINKQVQVELNGNFFNEKALDDLKQFESTVKLGALDDNDEDADEDEDDDEEEEEIDEEDLAAELSKATI